MYKYHGTEEHKRRLASNSCRCASESEGAVYSLSDLLKDGLIVDPSTRDTPLCTLKIRRYTTELRPARGQNRNTYIFCVDSEYNLHIAPDGERALEGSVKHETLFHNSDVLAAGEIYIHDGVISAINDHSGSYDTAGELEANPQFAATLLLAFRKSRVQISEALHEELKELTRD